MALAYSKDKEYHVQLSENDIGKYVILPGDPGRCERIASYFDNPRFIKSNREYTTYTGTLEGTPVSVVSTGIGGPSAVIAMEELIHCGAHTFIRVGTSGGMQKETLAGEMVIASGAIRMEGTTREYAPIEYPAVADFTVIQALVQAAKNKGATAHVGVVQCKDSFYGQHSPATMPVSYELEQKWEAWKRCGALASEMESAALYITGAVRRVRVGAILLVVGNQTRRELGLEDIQVHDTGPTIEVAIEALRLLIKQQ